MTLQEHIEEIRDGLNNGAFINEASVREYIVLRVLHELGWPRYNPQVIIPEHSVGGGQVDYALCHRPSEPSVFIEVKRVGQIEGAERQLFEYAFHTRVPIAILTDGREWHFFYPPGEGDYGERRVYQLDLIETDTEEIAERLNRYLNYYLIRNRNAIQSIADDYRDIAQRRHIEAVWRELSEHQRQHIEEARSELLEQESRLVELVAREVENQGDRPVDEQVLDFLKSLETEPPPPAPRQTRLVVIMPNGERINYHKAIDTFAEVIEKLGIEQVREFYPNLIFTSRSANHKYKVGQYYIKDQTSTRAKKQLLERIASKLGVRLKVEIVVKKSN